MNPNLVDLIENEHNLIIKPAEDLLSTSEDYQTTADYLKTLAYDDLAYVLFEDQLANGWDNETGQHMTGAIVLASPDGHTYFDDQYCTNSLLDDLLAGKDYIFSKYN